MSFIRGGYADKSISGIQTGIVPVTAVANQFMTGVGADGSITKAQPTMSNISDYEEGTFTVSYTFSTPGDLAVTYASRVGNYIKVGKKITVTIYIATSGGITYTTASGSLRLTGLPYAVGDADCMGSVNYTVGGVSNSAVTARAVSATSYIDFFLQELTTGAVSTVGVAQATSGPNRIIRLTLTYISA